MSEKWWALLCSCFNVSKAIFICHCRPFKYKHAFLPVKGFSFQNSAALMICWPQRVSLSRDSFWPNGVPAEPLPPRDFNTQMRTRVVAKSKMLGSISGRVTQMAVREVGHSHNTDEMGSRLLSVREVVHSHNTDEMGSRLLSVREVVHSHNTDEMGSLLLCWYVRFT